MELSLARPAMSLCATAEAFGPRIQTPLQIFRSVLKAASDIESASPRTRALVRPLEDHLDSLDDLVATLTDSDVLFNHITLLSTAADALAWVSNQAPIESVHAANQKAKEFLPKLRQMPHPTHAAFADAVENFLAKLAEYVHANIHGPLAFTDAPSARSPPAAPPRNDPPALPPRSPEHEPPTNALADAAKHTAPHLVHYRDHVLFASVAAFEQASAALGEPVKAQGAAFCNAMRVAYDYIVNASITAVMPTEEEQEKMFGPLLSNMVVLSEISNSTAPSDFIYNHLKAVEEAAILLSWIAADSAALSFVTDADESAGFFLDKVLMATKKQPDAAKHKQFVNALRAVFADITSYVKEYHSDCMLYNVGLEAKGGIATAASPVSAADDEGDGAESYVTAFKALIDGPLSAFVQASNTIGGEVAEQAGEFAGAWEAEAEFLGRAINMPKPDDIQDMLAPIAGKMGAVAAAVEKVDPRGSLAQHCNALGESVAALGWVAVDEKATAYVGDMAGAGQFFVDKVKMGAKKTNNPEAHRTWAKCLETLFADLKAYVKEHHTQKLVWNPPKSVRATRKFASTQDDDDGSTFTDYATAFKDIINRPLAVFVQASAVIGGEVAVQATAFASAWEAEAEFLSKAISMPKPDDIQEMLAPIASKMGEVGGIVEKVDPRGPLAQHCNAVGESVAALGWVAVEEKATSYVGDMAGAGQFFVDKVKMGAKKTDNPEAHRAWAKALETLFAALKSYVKEHHTQKLVWNPPKAAKAKRTVATIDPGETGAGNSDYVTAFKSLIDGPLAAFVDASNTIGGEVADQATAFAGAWEAEAEFLGKAISMPKPDDIQDMLAPIAAKMGVVGDIVQKVDPRGPLAHHCHALGESVAALGWVAVDEKATGFVGDMAGAGQFFLDKVKMAAKKTDNPDAHRTWAKSLETLFADLKAYVKEYHTQKLVWDCYKA